MILPATQRDIAFRVRRWFAAPRQIVFRAWTEKTALRQWWCPMNWIPGDIELDLRAGGAYKIGMRNAETNQEISVSGRFLEVRSPELLVYTWNWSGAFEEMPETRLTVQFNVVDNGTEVTLLQEHLPEIGICLRHRAAWIAAWERLNSVLPRPSGFHIARADAGGRSQC